MAVFKNTDKWEWMSGMDGLRRKIENSAAI